MSTFIWNLRFYIGQAILPGKHKHISVRKTNRPCSRCF